EIRPGRFVRYPPAGRHGPGSGHQQGVDRAYGRYDRFRLATRPGRLLLVRAAQPRPESCDGRSTQMRALKRILHIEDVPSIQIVTRIALERIGGFEVLSCASAQAALAEVRAFAPDLILLDVMLPQMDGIELLRQLAGLVDLQQTPVVLLTGHLERERLTELQQMGVREVLQKPFDPLQLTAQLRAIWEAEHE